MLDVLLQHFANQRKRDTKWREEKAKSYADWELPPGGKQQNSAKPHISRSKGAWLCRDDEDGAFQHTPELAYNLWKARKAK